MTGFVIVGAALLLVAGILWFFLIFPILMVIHCTNAAHSNKAKVWWIVGMVLFWPFVGWIYALVRRPNRFYQFTAGLAIAGGIGLMALVFTRLPDALEVLAQRPKQLSGKLTDWNTSGLSDRHHSQLIAALYQLDQELTEDSNWLRRWERFDRLDPLLDLLEVYGADDVLTVEETESWLDKYRDRDLLDEEALERLVDQERRRR